MKSTSLLDVSVPTFITEVPNINLSSIKSKGKKSAMKIMYSNSSFTINIKYLHFPILDKLKCFIFSQVSTIRLVYCDIKIDINIFNKP